MAGLRTSVGIWAFGPNATRFMPGGYHPEAARETILQRTQRAAEALRGVADGFEYHYPSEINDDTASEIRKVLGGMDIYCLALGLFSDPRYGLGGFIHPDRRRRAEVVETAKAGVTLAARLGAHFIIWPGGEGYNYNFQIDYASAWRWHVPRRAWSEEILRTLEIPAEWLPACAESPVLSAAVSGVGEEATGLRAGTPVAAGGGDQAPRPSEPGLCGQDCCP